MTFRLERVAKKTMGTDNSMSTGKRFFFAAARLAQHISWYATAKVSSFSQLKEEQSETRKPSTKTFKAC
jgi:hypothetical protein